MKKIFSGQNDTEKIILTIKPHFLAVFKDLVMPLVIVAASVVGMSYYYYNFAYFIVLFILFVFSSFWFFYAYYIWTHDLYVVTDQRIVDIDQVSIFHSAQKETYLNNVQDIIVSKKGIAATLFDFGTVSIQTASSTQIDLSDVPHPLYVKKQILDLVKLVKDSEDKHAEMSPDEMIKKLYEMLKNNADQSASEQQKNG